MLRIKFSYLNLVDLDDPISGNYYFGAEAYDIDGHYWEPRIVDSFSIERFFDVEMDVSNRIRTISVSLDNGDKFFNKFAETGKTLLNSQMSLYYDDGQNKTKHFTGKVSKIDSFGTVVKLTLREIGYEYLENNFPDAQIAYDYYSENGINESWNCIPIHFGTVKSIPVSWVNSYESEYMIGSGPILNVKRIYIDEDDEEEKNLLYDSEAENPQKEYKANDDAKPIYVRIFKGFGYDADGHREVVIDDVGKEGETPDQSDNKFHHESKWGGFAYIQLYSIDDDGYEIPAYPYTKDGGIGQVRVDIEGICELDEDSGDYVMVRNPAKIIKMMFVNPELVSEGECAIGWGYTENQVDFDQAIADCETLGYKIDGSFDSTMQFGEALKQICYHCRGYVVEESEKITLNIDMPKSTVGVPRFDDEGLHGDTCDLTEWSEPSIDEQINRIRLNYDWNLKTGKFDKKPSVNHQSPDWEQNQNYDNWLEDTEHAERIGKWNPQTVEFKMIRDCETAHRLAIYYLRKKSKQLIEAKIVVPSEKAMNLDAGDLIRVMSAQMDWYKETISVDANSGNETRIIDKTEGKLFQITQISKSEENTEISISEYDSSIFAADSATFTAYDVPAPVASKLLPMAPLSVTLTAGYESGSDEFSANNVYVNGTIEYDSEGSKNYAVVQYADLGTTVPTQSDIESASYLTHGMITETTFRINYLMAGHYYAVRVYTANNYGNSSATLSSAILVSGNTNVPPAPTLSHTSETGQTIGYTLTGKTVKLRITLDNSDLSGELAQKFRIYRNGQFIKEELATYSEYQKTSSPLVYWGKYTADSIDLVEQYDTSYSYYATCVSKWGVESLPSSTITFSTPEELDLDYVLETIENIQADQEEMDERLTAIASDDLITAGEKASIRKDWASVQAKYNKLHPVIIAEPYDFDANPLKSQYGTDYTAYETAYLNLSSYLTNTIAINVNADVEGTGVVSALAEKFNDYVDNELKILADIDECNKLLAQTVSLTCSTAANNAAKVIVSENLKIFDGLRLTVTFANGNSDTNNDFSINVKNTANGNNICGNQLYFKGSRITDIIFDSGTALTFVYDSTNDRWEAAESTQLLWSESPTAAGVYDLSHINGGKLYVDSIESQSIKANAITAEKINAGAVTTAKLDAGAVTSEKITSNAIIGKTFVTVDGVGTIDSSTNKYISGVKFDSNGIVAWSEDGKTVEIKNDGSATFTGSITANSGFIAGWTVNSDNLSSIDGKTVLNKNGSITLTNGTNIISIDPTNGIKETNNGTVKFQLSQAGKLTATDAEITGQITATSGNIGGWVVDGTNGKLYKNDLILDSTGSISGDYNSTNNTGWILREDGTANIGKLSVTSTGGITSSQFSIDGTTGNATFSGNLSAATGSFSGSITATGGSIGGWTINTNDLSSTDGKVVLNKNGTITLSNTINSVLNTITLDPTNGIKETSGSTVKFQLSQTGKLTATDAEISGQITATSGSIGGWTVGNSDLHNGNLYLDSTGNLRGNYNSTNNTGWRLNADGTANIGKLSVTSTGGISSTQFSIDGTTGNATFSGALSAASGSFSGSLSSASVDTNGLTIGTGTNQIKLNSTDGIKATNFQIATNGNVTMTGSVTATSGKIANWTIDGNNLKSSNLILDGANGAIKSNNYSTGTSGWQIKGDGTAEFVNATVSGNITASSGNIGGWTVNQTNLTSNNSKVVLANDGTITLNNASSSPTNIITIDPTNGIKETNNGTVKFQLSQAGKLTATDAEISGKITATDGLIGGWSIGNNTISSNGLILGGTDGTIKSSNFTTGDNGTGWQIKGDGTAEFNGVVARGTIKSNSGIIGGWTINSNSLSNNGININSTGSINGNYVSGVSGWNVNYLGDAEFNSATVRGAIKSAVFEYDKVSAVGGQMLVKKASVTVSYAHTSTSLKVKDAIHFSVGDIFVVKKDATNVFWGLISAKTTNADGTGILTYSIPDGGGSFFSPDNGQSVVNYGNVNSGGVLIDGDKPYIDIFKNKTNPNMFNPILNLSAKNSTTASIAQDNGVIDVSGNGNNGRAYNGVQIVEDSTYGNVFSFDGVDDYIDANIDVSNSITALTIDFNIFVDSDCNGTHRIFWTAEQSTSSNCSFSIYYNNRSGKFIVETANSSGNYSNLNFGITKNQWINIALTFDNTSKKVICYKNGTLVTQLDYSSSGDRVLSSKFLEIGNLRTGQYLKGKIHTFRIYPYALTADEVKMLYAQTTNKHVLSNGAIQLDHIARMGNLNGVADISTDLYGLFIGDKSIKQYLQYDSDNGLQIGGDVKIESGVPLNKLDIVRQWQMDDNSTYINGGKIYANSITSAQLASDAIQSTGYTQGQDGFSTTGSLFNLANGSIVTPSFRIDADGTAHFKNNVSIQSNDVSTNTLDVNGNSNFGGNIIPKTTNAYDIGSSTYKWKDAYINNLHGTVDDVKETAINIPSGEILCLSPNGCTTASIANDNGVIDVSGNGNHGRCIDSNIVNIVSDENGIGYNFIEHHSGNHKIKIPSNFLSNVKDISVYAKVKITGWFQNQNLTVFSIGYNTSGYNGKYGIYFDVANLKFEIGAKINKDETYKSLYSQNNVYVLNTLADIVFNIKYIDDYKIKLQLYLNTELIIDGILTFETAYQNDAIKPYFYLGSFYTGENDFNSFKGIIYDYHIYPYALTPTQVKSLYMISKNTQNVESLRRLNDFHLATDTQIDNLFT